MSRISRWCVPAALGWIGVASTAFGSIIITPGNGSGTPVKFNMPGLTQTGNMVQGEVGSSTGIVDFFANNQTLTTAPGQQVSATNGDLTSLTVFPGSSNVSFGTVVLNLKTSQSGGTVDFTVDSFDAPQFTESLPLKKSGENFFTVSASPGQQIASISLASNVSISRVSQVQVVVPEPASLSALLGVAGLLTARRRQP